MNLKLSNFEHFYFFHLVHFDSYLSIFFGKYYEKSQKTGVDSLIDRSEIRNQNFKLIFMIKVKTVLKERQKKRNFI